MLNRGKKSGNNAGSSPVAPVSPGASSASADASKTRYKTVVMGLSKERKVVNAQMVELAARLGCRPSDMFFEGARLMLLDPPTTAPVCSIQSTGAACGFWVVPICDKEGRATSVSVVEVMARRVVSNGRTFFRYTRGDAKARLRALTQARRGALYDCKMVGISEDVAVMELEDASRASA